MSDTDTQRRWLFYVTDWNDERFYVDADGHQGSYEDLPMEFVGTDNEAIREGDRRADLWEVKQDAMAASVTRESRGRVEVGG